MKEDCVEDFIEDENKPICIQCGDEYLTEIADAMNYTDHLDNFCHHCRHYEGDIDDKEHGELCKMEMS